MDIGRVNGEIMGISRFPVKSRLALASLSKAKGRWKMACSGNSCEMNDGSVAQALATLAEDPGLTPVISIAAHNHL